ncbi:MAG: hypothetical protein U0R52_10020 [Solirubrobacterales bacterium]
MRRMIVPVAIAAAIALPGTALAAFYSGPFTPEVNNDGIEIKVAFRKGEPRLVTRVEYHNVATGSPCNGSYLFFRAMKVSDKLRFSGSGHPGKAGNAAWPPFPNQTVTIKGRFTNHSRKVVGTFRLRGAGPCSGDSGAIDFTVPRIK